MRPTPHTLHKKNPASSGVVKKAAQKSVHSVPKSKQKIASPYFKKVKRFAKQGIKSTLMSPVFHSSFKIIATAVVVTSMLYGSYLYIGKTFANEIVVSQSEIVARVGKLMSLPSESPYEIVRVQDEEDLRKQNKFYKDVKEGEYILIYKNLAVIYDLRNNVIVGVKRD
jgi:hypothetical protein